VIGCVFLQNTRWCSWLKHRATSWKVTCAIPDGFIGILRRIDPSGHIMALKSIHPIIEKSTMNISLEVKADGV
jgi:hypothetical protein